MLPNLPDFDVDGVIKRALEEDINYIDVTTDLLISSDIRGMARLVAKDEGVLSGIDIAVRVFTMLDSSVNCDVLIKDGEFLKTGDVFAEIEGGTASILKAERTALNLLQHMSGIATYTRLCVDKVAGTGVSIVDTRKTLPGLRTLQKYAVLCGGGKNHRFNLSSGVMIKDNHVDVYGSISQAVAKLRERAGHMVIIEVEVRDLEQLREAIDVGVDVVMLDNMSLNMMKEAVNIVGEGSARPHCTRPKLEASGNVTLDNIRKTALTGVDVISVGALTHSARALDISLKWGK